MHMRWAVDGRAPIVTRVIGRLVDLGRMIGRDFEAGLANLRITARQP